MFIQDLIPRVVSKLGNRTDINAKALVWIRDSVLELTQNYRFEELIVYGPTVALQADNPLYDKTFFTNNKEELTHVNTWFLEIDSNSGIGFELKYRTAPVVEPMSKIPGLPVYWTRIGTQILFGMSPNKAYNTQMSYQRKHPFSDLSVLANDQIMMPDDWKEIIEYAAAERGALEERQMDYATAYHSVIFGDPTFEKSGSAGEGKPGLIFRRVSQMERDSSNNERQMVPVVDRYTG